MIEFIKQLLFARKCLFCGQVLEESRENVFCPKCRLEYEKLKRRTCHICKKPQKLCECLPPSLNREVAWSVHLFAYDDPLSKTVVFALKRRDFKALQHFLGEDLASLLGDVSNYAVTYAPRKPKSVREYGFDQAEVLARIISEEKELPLVEPFSHVHDSALQKNLNAEKRAENAEKSYKLRKHFVREHENLIIVDDVVTTGSTMRKLVSLAKEIGYREVAVVFVAKTVHEKEKL